MKEDEIAARNLALQEEEEGLDEYDEECGKERKGIASSNQKQSFAPAMRLVDEEDELEEDLDEDDLGYEDVEYDDEDDNNGVSEDEF
ncbi:hypothetical protein F2Q68_00032733 [Brassica cretica]|uniref:Uncharacterized protein n=1 Tax=Brassica cretica TaxID=69181 RepID=A0A8S9GBZ3_BRACR|nr:hypothetical protein F2Q68_00032733 [Brassica cretica]